MIGSRHAVRATAGPSDAGTEAAALWAWTAVAAWMGVVLTASGESFSASHTLTWVSWSAQIVWGEVARPDLDMMNLIVRKLAHFVEYAILGWLSFRAARLTRPTWPAAAWAVVALSTALACAVVDETHQSFEPTRTSSPRDVALDTFGGTSAAVLAVAMHRRRAGFAS
jgi:VanZ family protein